MISRIETFEEDSGLKLNLENFADYYHVDIRTIYARDSFSRLCVDAGIKKDFTEPLESVMQKAFTRFCTIDSRRLIEFTLPILESNKAVFTAVEERMLQMIQFTIWQKPFEECGFGNILEGIDRIKGNPTMCGELIELLKYKYNHIDFIDEKVHLGFECPLDLHCTYTRDQILVAMDFLKPNTVREGVKYLPDKKIDIFFVTLNKSDKDYSPTTMYKDYSINDILFHWQSQSTTADTSPTRQRYIHHKETDNKILLFVREFKTDRVLKGAGAYTFLGTANYIIHEGSQPMNITWKLDKPIPGKFLKKTNKLVVG